MFSIKHIVLGIAIFILTISVGVYGISTLFGEPPQYDDYCPYISTPEECTSQGYTWMNNTYYDSRVPTPEAKPILVEGGSCDVYTKCQQPWENAERQYFKKVFLAALPLGIIIIIVGALVFGLESVGAGLMAGGIGVIIYGVGQYWRFTDDWLKFALSLVGLIAVICLAYYWNKKWHDFGKGTSEVNRRKK